MHVPYSLCHVRFTSVGLHACPAPPLKKQRTRGNAITHPQSHPIHKKNSTFSEWEGTEDIGNGSLGPRLLPSHILCATKAAWGGAWE